MSNLAVDDDIVMELFEKDKEVEEVVNVAEVEQPDEIIIDDDVNAEPFIEKEQPSVVEINLQQDNEEEIDILGTSDNEDGIIPGTANVGNGQSLVNGSQLHNNSAPSTSEFIPKHTRVVIPTSQIKKRIPKKAATLATAATKYVKENNKPSMTIDSRDYNYMEDELFFSKADIPVPFEDVRPFEHDIAMRPLGEQRYVVEAIENSFRVLQMEAKRIQGHLRALNARAGRIRKQIDREEEAIARGEDPTAVPKSSKGLFGDEILPIKIPVKVAPKKPVGKKKLVKRKKPGPKKGKQPKAEVKETKTESQSSGGRMLKLSGFDNK